MVPVAGLGHGRMLDSVAGDVFTNDPSRHDSEVSNIQKKYNLLLAQLSSAYFLMRFPALAR